MTQAARNAVRVIGGREIARLIAATPLENARLHDLCRKRLAILPFAEQIQCKAELGRIRAAQRGRHLAEIIS